MEWNQITRVRQDSCTQTLSEKQSQKPGQYSILPLGYKWCESGKNYAHLMSEPAHQQKQYYNGCNVDRDTETRNIPATNLRNIHQLYTRPYLGAYKGAGMNTSNNKNLETEILSGWDSRGMTRRSCDVLSGVTIDRFHCLPEYGNPQRVQHVIESWIRGGDNTRDYVRRINYEAKIKNKKTTKIANQLLSQIQD